MRTAEDIVNDYTERGYDQFRIRAIAALRPEPMRSEILSLLDEFQAVADEAEGMEEAIETLDTPSTILAALNSETGEFKAPVDAVFDTVAAGQSITEEVEMLCENYIDEVEEVPEEVLNEEPSQPLVSSEESDTGFDAFWDTGSDIVDDEDFEPVVQDKEDEEGEVEAVEVTEEVLTDMSSNSVGLEEDIPSVSSDDCEVATAYPSWSEIYSALSSQAEYFEFLNWVSKNVIEPVADIAVEEDQDIMAEVSCQNAAEQDNFTVVPVEEVTPSVSENEIVIDPVEVVNAERETGLSLVTHNDVIDHAVDDNSKVIYAFDWSEDGEDGLEDEFFETLDSNRFELVGSKNDSEWVDCGSGLIMLPKSLHDSFNAYSQAQNKDPLVDSIDSEIATTDTSIEDLMSALIEGEDQLEECIGNLGVEFAVNNDLSGDSETLVIDAEDQVSTVSTDQQYVLDLGIVQPTVKEPITSLFSDSEPEKIEEPEEPLSDYEEVMGLLWPTTNAPPAVAGTPAPLSMREGSDAVDSEREEIFEKEIACLEKHLTEVEEVIVIKDRELCELRELVSSKDEILTTQYLTLEEERNRRVELEAEVTELKPTGEHLQAMTEEVASLRIRLAEAECERNILKTDTVPALEEQQLSLVNLLEDENRQTRIAVKAGNRSRRGMFAGMSMAAAMGLFAIVTPVLRMNLVEQAGSASEAIEMVTLNPESESEREVEKLKQVIARLENEKAAVYAASEKIKAEKLRREGILLSKYKDLEEKMNKEKLSLVAALNRQQQASENWTGDRLAGNSSVSRGATPSPSAVATARTPEPRSSSTVCVVKSGDSFSEIVREHYGTANREIQEKVAKVNGINNPNQIYVGQKIRMVAMAPEDE